MAMVFYFVQRGETLYHIAKRYQTTVHAIVAANRLDDPNAVCPGQALMIPKPGEVPSPPPGGIVHLVRPGETIFHLARRFGTSAQDIMRANQIAHSGFTLWHAPRFPPVIAQAAQVTRLPARWTAGDTATRHRLIPPAPVEAEARFNSSSCGLSWQDLSESLAKRDAVFAVTARHPHLPGASRRTEGTSVPERPDQIPPIQQSASGQGGSANQVGGGFQRRVAAWLAVRMLAEGDASAPWDLPAHTVFTSIRCETEHPVDDLLVGTSEQGRIFIQVKHRTGLETSPDSDLASTLDQFVRQYLACARTTSHDREDDGPLNPARDRLVLVTAPHSSATVRLTLERALRKRRENGLLNAEEARALVLIRDHITRSSLQILGRRLAAREIGDLLSLIWIQTLDVDEGGDGEREAKDLLRRTVLHHPAQADDVWAVLVEHFAYLAGLRGCAFHASIPTQGCA